MLRRGFSANAIGNPLAIISFALKKLLLVVNIAEAPLLIASLTQSKPSLFFPLIATKRVPFLTFLESKEMLSIIAEPKCFDAVRKENSLRVNLILPPLRQVG